MSSTSSRSDKKEDDSSTPSRRNEADDDNKTVPLQNDDAILLSSKNDASSLEPSSGPVTTALDQRIATSAWTTQGKNKEDDKAKKKAVNSDKAQTSIATTDNTSKKEPRKPAVASNAYSPSTTTGFGRWPVDATLSSRLKQHWGPQNTTTPTTSFTEGDNPPQQVHVSDTGKVRVNAPPGPRAIHVAGPQFHLHQNPASSDSASSWLVTGEHDDNNDEANATPNAPLSPEGESPLPTLSDNDNAFVVPVATLVTENSKILVPAVAQDNSCLGRLGQRGCLILAGVQVVIIVVAVVVVMTVVSWGKDDDAQRSNPLSVAPATGMPTFSTTPSLQPTPNITSLPTVSPSYAPSGVPTEFPVPEECIFEIQSIDPIVPDQDLQVSTCAQLPLSVELTLVGQRCNETFCTDPTTTTCQDYPENGSFPESLSDDKVLVRLVGQNTPDQALSVGETLLIGSTGSSDPIPVNSILEIHRNEVILNETTILQRVVVNVRCAEQILCGVELGAWMVTSFANAAQGLQPCFLFSNTEPIQFNFTISIQPKLPQGEDTAIIQRVLVETNFTNPSFLAVTELVGTVLTTSDRAVDFYGCRID